MNHLPVSQPIRWHYLRRTALWFVALYTILYTLPLTDMEAIIELTEWVGPQVLHLDNAKKIWNTGSGDTSFSYAYLFVLSSFCLGMAVLLAAVVGPRRNYTLFYVLTQTFVRYYLAYFMLFYGFAKVFEGQFISPPLISLEQTYGNSSPMGIVWVMMGLSKAYAVFGGLGEVVGGLLLFFRRTKTLGALLIVAVMTNVVMLNFAYDIPVKLFSSYLLLLTFFVLTPDIPALVRLFLLQQPAQLNQSSLALSGKGQRLTHTIGKTLVILFLIMKTSGSFKPFPDADIALRGTYKAETFVLGTDTLPPLTTDSIRWQKLLIENSYGILLRMNNKQEYYNTKIDEQKKTIRFTNQYDSTQRYTLNYVWAKDTFQLRGEWEGKPLQASFRRRKVEDYTLTGRGFHWISEYPYNR